jgi:nitronate monooxygenase
MGTPFIATRESMAPQDYQQMLVDSTVEDLIVTNAFTGVNASMLKPSIRLQGLDPDNLKPKTTIDFDDPQSSMKAWKDIWSAGQGVTQVREILPVSALVQQLRQEYAEAVAAEVANPWRELAMQHL